MVLDGRFVWQVGRWAVSAPAALQIARLRADR